LAGKPIKTFGGVASGPEPLKVLHNTVTKLFDDYLGGEIDGKPYTLVMLRTDIANLIGCCVVAGNVRRSAQIALQSIDVNEFLDFKNYDVYPYRASFGWMSNNSVTLDTPNDFLKLPEIAKRVIKNGEPGYLNRMNFKYGRIGKLDEREKYGVLEDRAIGINPCGELVLEDREVCNLAETYPSNCDSLDAWYKAIEYATFYATTVNLLPTHLEDTNRVLAKNRRIGISISGFIQWKEKTPLSIITQALRHGYGVVRKTNNYWSDDAGVPRAIRVTTIKPSGSISKVFGVTSGAHHPPFSHVIRRVNIDNKSDLVPLLKDAGVPIEDSAYSVGTLVCEFPLNYGKVRPATHVSLWEQASNLLLLQREWADNAVSITLYFSKDEEDEVERVLSFIAPHTKSASLLPHTEQGVYAQMPEEGISFEEYERRKMAIKNIQWISTETAINDDVYCSGGSCELRK
jgi:ribonucleoside-diphosphate reductase alpha chain